MATWAPASILTTNISQPKYTTWFKSFYITINSTYIKTYNYNTCTCMAKQTHSSNYINLLECVHDQSHVPSPHQLPHICLSRMRVKISSFQNKSFLFSKTHYRISVKILDYPPSRIGWRTSRNSHGPHPK